MNKSVLFYAIFLSASINLAADSPDKSAKNISTNEYLYYISDFSFLKDTVYTFKESFLEVNLKTQMGYIHFKDSVKEFGVSTGTKWVLDGVETKEGLFVIQSKMPQWHSRQFDSTLMLNWMGFNYGIGFHALASNSYYRHLGVKKSSHGCVRITREDAVFIYKHIELGTPVLVHSENHVVFVGFAGSSGYYNYVKYDIGSLKKEMPKRYDYIYDGEYFLRFNPKLIIDYSNVAHTGIPIGNRKKTPRRQIVPPIYKYVLGHLPLPQKLVLIEKENISQQFTMEEKSAN